MVDGMFWDDSFEQDSGTTISGIEGTHQNSIRVRMPVLMVVPRVTSKLVTQYHNAVVPVVQTLYFGGKKVSCTKCPVQYLPFAPRQCGA